jgi:outer membrane lipoprotein carrier protein
VRAGRFVIIYSLDFSAPPTLPRLLTEVEKKYSSSKVFRADFEQTVTKPAWGIKDRTSKGILTFQRPNKFRFEITEPDKNLVINDGKKFYSYTPPFAPGESGQVLIEDAKKIKSKLLDRLLTGSFTLAFSKGREMTIETKNSTEFILTPKKGTSGDVLSALIEIDPKAKLIHKVTLDQEGGNRTEILLKNIDLKAKVGANDFKFVAPPKTEVIKAH